MERAQAIERIGAVGLIAVIRGASADQAERAAEAVAAGGIAIVEITLTVPGALTAIERLARRREGEVLVGAGTVLDGATARRCLRAGARFIVSPGLEREVVAAARGAGAVAIAGALTPSEVLAAWRAGADFVKVFPCGAAGGARYLEELRGPLPEIPLIPTGGVNLANAAACLRAGAAALGVGGELVAAAALERGDLAAITAAARAWVALVCQAREEMRATGAVPH